MKRQAIADRLGLERLTPVFEHEVGDAYVSDVIDDVIANVKAGHLVVTVQVHANAAAAANLVDLCRLVVAQGKRPEGEVLKMATKAPIPVFSPGNVVTCRHAQTALGHALGNLSECGSLTPRFGCRGSRMRYERIGEVWDEIRRVTPLCSTALAQSHAEGVIWDLDQFPLSPVVPPRSSLLASGESASVQPPASAAFDVVERRFDRRLTALFERARAALAGRVAGPRSRRAVFTRRRRTGRPASPR